MKRIKLFEAFSNLNKIGRVNFILLCWAIRSLIKENELKPVQPKYHSIAYNNKYFDDKICFVLKSSSSWFLYNPVVNRLAITCQLAISNYLVVKKIVNPYRILRTHPSSNIINDSAQYVIKKMYEDEKNKAI